MSRSATQDRTPAAFDRAAALLAWLALNPGLHPRRRSRRASGPTCSTRARARACGARSGRCGRQLGEDANGRSSRPATASGSRRRRLGRRRARPSGSAPAGQLEEALALGEGELLPGLEDEWAFEARDEHRARTAAVLEQLAARPEAAGDLRRAARPVAARRRARAALGGDSPLADAPPRGSGRPRRRADRVRRAAQPAPDPPEDGAVGRDAALADSLRAGSAAPSAAFPGRLLRADRREALRRPEPRARTDRRRLRVASGGARRRSALLAGEAGSGKSRLAARFAVEAGASGATVLYGWCDEQALVPYEPFAEAVGGRALDRGRDRVEAARSRCRGDRSCSCSTICSGPTGRRSASSRRLVRGARRANGSSCSARTATTTRSERRCWARSPTCAATATSSGSRSTASPSTRWRR